jgi:branched-chain amino acid transport system permease protein
MYYFMALGILVLVYFALRQLTRSQFGLLLAGVRLQEARMAFFGYRVQVCKSVVFALAGLLAGVSGGLYAFHEGYVGPGQLGPVLSTQVVLYVLFGGTGTLVGGLVGVGVIDLLSYLLSQKWETGWPIVLGLLLLVVVTFRPTGLLGFIVSERERIGTFGRISGSRDGK